jgi:hypothetical protein
MARVYLGLLGGRKSANATITADTRVMVTIGTRCCTHAATLKMD